MKSSEDDRDCSFVDLCSIAIQLHIFYSRFGWMAFESSVILLSYDWLAIVLPHSTQLQNTERLCTQRLCVERRRCAERWRIEMQSELSSKVESTDLRLRVHQTNSENCVMAPLQECMNEYERRQGNFLNPRPQLYSTIRVACWEGFFVVGLGFFLKVYCWWFIVHFRCAALVSLSDWWLKACMNAVVGRRGLFVCTLNYHKTRGGLQGVVN